MYSLVITGWFQFGRAQKTTSGQVQLAPSSVHKRASKFVHVGTQNCDALLHGLQRVLVFFCRDRYGQVETIAGSLLTQTKKGNGSYGTISICTAWSLAAKVTSRNLRFPWVTSEIHDIAKCSTQRFNMHVLLG